jgi:predicted PurR-regulated permease PerM
VARIISFLALVGFILVFAALFYQVIAPFLLPLFLAGVLALLFRPWYQWFTHRLNGRRRLAAGVTTAVVVLIVLIPVAGVLSMATVQLVRLVPQTLHAAATRPRASSAASGPSSEAKQDRPPSPDSRTPSAASQGGPAPMAERDSVAGERQDATGRVQPRAAEGEDTAGEPSQVEPPQRAVPSVHEWRMQMIERVQRVFPVEANQVNQAIDSAIRALAERTLRLLVDLAGFVVGLLITVVALYFFFVDGPRMLETMQRLTPIEDRHERELMHQFDTVCRAVVFATLASAVVQGVLAGIGFLIVGLHRQVFVLSILTTLFAMIPFLGTAAVWLPTAAVLWWVDQRWEAIFLVVYGAGCVATVDNLIKPYILHGRAKLHPLLALLSVLGGVQALGLWGIFIGPVVAAFLYALLNILHQEMKAFAEADSRRRDANPTVPAAPEPTQTSGKKTKRNAKADTKRR